MRHYEIVAVIHPDQQGRISAMIDLYKNIVTDGGGVMHRLEDWGRRPLAYPIQNQHKAQYLLMNIECGDDTLDKLRETFRFSDSIMRSLVVRRETAPEGPSVMMKHDKPAKEEDLETEEAYSTADFVEPSDDDVEDMEEDESPEPNGSGDSDESAVADDKVEEEKE